jgi:hypothetical protein
MSETTVCQGSLVFEERSVEFDNTKWVKQTTFREELISLINRYSKENGSNTPDYILARFLDGCLKAFDLATLERDRWYHGGKIHCPGAGLIEE